MPPAGTSVTTTPAFDMDERVSLESLKEHCLWLLPHFEGPFAEAEGCALCVTSRALPLCLSVATPRQFPKRRALCSQHQAHGQLRA